MTTVTRWPHGGPLADARLSRSPRRSTVQPELAAQTPHADRVQFGEWEPQAVREPIAPVTEQLIPDVLPDDLPEPPPIPPARPQQQNLPQEGFFTNLFRRVGGFFKHLYKAFRSLIAPQPPATLSKRIGKNLGNTIEYISDHPNFQAAMQQTHSSWETVLTDPRWDQFPEIKDALLANAELLESPDGRQAALGATVLEMLMSGTIQSIIQQGPVGSGMILQALLQEQQPSVEIVSGTPDLSPEEIQFSLQLQEMDERRRAARRFQEGEDIPVAQVVVAGSEPIQNAQVVDQSNQPVAAEPVSVSSSTTAPQTTDANQVRRNLFLEARRLRRQQQQQAAQGAT